ncbi:anthranilate phosphoribosyltransferase [Candidatus Woesearchaeota archaeon]|nr:anthranilate phosphoribosyltransferase [Candidatus Woesearchaeota archaeon]
MKEFIGKDLSSKEAYTAMSAILDDAGTGEIKEFLIAMNEKGVSIDELIGFARGMKERANIINPDVGTLVDTCGTGGDCSGTINASTYASFLVSAAGIPVAKHGNYSVSSKSGSANLMEELGYNLESAPEAVKDMIENLGYGFCFAPKFHPAMKKVAPVRKEIGKKTIFNLLGPLCNPANAKAQLIGVYDGNLCEKFCHALDELGLERAMVVYGSGLDEISNIGETIIYELCNGDITTYIIKPEDFGFKRYNLEDISCSSPAESAEYIRNILNGEKGARRDLTVLNAGAGIYLGNGAKSLEEGIKKAEDVLDSREAKTKLLKIVEYSRGLYD